LPKNDRHIICDKRQVQIALSNLISNATQAIGNKEGTISFTIYDSKDRVLVSIHDSGRGIPKDILPKIFEPLFTTKNEGTGLGLVSCKNIVESHGGMISVDSDPEKGTLFVISFPNSEYKESIGQVERSN